MPIKVIVSISGTVKYAQIAEIIPGLEIVAFMEVDEEEPRQRGWIKLRSRQRGD